MAILKWDPLGNIMTLQDRINQLFDDSFPRRINEGDASSVCAWTPDVDIFETDQGLVVAVDLPGVDKKEVMVEVRNNVLTISGNRVTDPVEQSVNHYRRERQCGTFQRSFTLHAAILPEQIKATFKNGVLFIKIPNPEPDVPRRIGVDIG